ncbi:MAG TPA: hypothetical protein VIY48_00580 [Candidatus Paceibacterota bacterium]
MPYALIIAGIVLTVAGVRNTQGELYSLLINDFTGQKSFVWWSLSILGVGAVGYVQGLRPLSNAFLALLFIVLIIANKGVFQQFTEALKNPIPPVGTKPADKTASTSTSTSSSTDYTQYLQQGAAVLASALG